jgi:putative flippase GtrA
MSEWGLFILCLISLSIGMIFIYRRENAFALAGGSSSSNKMSMFDKSLFAKVLAVTLGLAVAGLYISYLILGSVTITDTIGSVISAAVIAFMAHLFILFRRNEN